ncbi:MAG: hypothetical protein JWO31_2900 [Phycisphaerales bacterium]|nr:hypothetical protein [Phycisphaerales bacterium]
MNQSTITPAAAVPSHADVADREIVQFREYDAPRDLVYRAWTDPAHLAKWWGPRGFTTTTFSMDVSPGGVWRFVMHGPDGTDYQNKVTYLEVVPPERLVFNHGGGDEGCESMSHRTTVTFEDAGGGRTRLTMRALFVTAEAKAYVVEKHGAIEGGKQTLARLAEYLPTM